MGFFYLTSMGTSVFMWQIHRFLEHTSFKVLKKRVVAHWYPDFCKSFLGYSLYPLWLLAVPKMGSETVNSRPGVMLQTHSLTFVRRMVVYSWKQYSCRWHNAKLTCLWHCTTSFRSILHDASITCLTGNWPCPANWNMVVFNHTLTRCANNWATGRLTLFTC